MRAGRVLAAVVVAAFLLAGVGGAYWFAWRANTAQPDPGSGVSVSYAPGPPYGDAVLMEVVGYESVRVSVKPAKGGPEVWGDNVTPAAGAAWRFGSASGLFVVTLQPVGGVPEMRLVWIGEASVFVANSSQELVSLMRLEVDRLGA